MRLHTTFIAFFTTSLVTVWAHAEPERVQLADGSVYQGELIEKVPSDHVTIKLATGEVRRFEWRELAPATEPPPVVVSPPIVPATMAPEIAHVRVEADSSGAVLMRNPGYGTTFASQQGLAAVSVMTSDQNPVPVCYAPCSAEIDPRATYYVTGAYVSRTRSFPLPSGDSVLHINPGNSTLAAVGGWALGLGIVTILVGAVVLPLSFVNLDSTSPSPPGLSGWQWAGIGTLIAGASLSLLSIPFIVGGLSHASVNGISVARGKLRFTPRGLVF